MHGCMFQVLHTQQANGLSLVCLSLCVQACVSVCLDVQRELEQLHSRGKRSLSAGDGWEGHVRRGSGVHHSDTRVIKPSWSLAENTADTACGQLKGSFKPAL